MKETTLKLYNHSMPSSASPSAHLLSDPLRRPVEKLVSDHYHSPWRVTAFTDLHDLASHPAAILTGPARAGPARAGPDRAGPDRAVFVKFSQAAHALHQFETELSGLRYLAQHAAVLIPTPLGILPVEGGVLLVLEAVQAVQRAPHHWREMGRALARIHQHTGPTYGFPQQSYFGPLYQDNRPHADWLTFYAERRLWPRLIGAIDSGFLPTAVIRQVEKFITRLPHLEIPPSPPCLLHGDAQQNNFISTPHAALVIDPAVYYGHPEMDLAYLDYFQPVPEDVFLGYQEIRPIQPGFPARRDLWRVPAYLAAVQVEGPAHLPKLTAALQPYL